MVILGRKISKQQAIRLLKLAAIQRNPIGNPYFDDSRYIYKDFEQTIDNLNIPFDPTISVEHVLNALLEIIDSHIPRVNFMAAYILKDSRIRLKIFECNVYNSTDYSIMLAYSTYVMRPKSAKKRRHFFILNG